MARKFLDSTPQWVFVLLAIIQEPVGWVNVIGLGLFASGEMPAALDFVSAKLLFGVVLLDKVISRTLKIYKNDEIS